MARVKMSSASCSLSFLCISLVVSFKTTAKMTMMLMTMTALAVATLPVSTAQTTHADLVNAVTSTCSLVVTSDVLLTSSLPDVVVDACPEVKIVGSCGSRRCKIDGADKCTFIRFPKYVHLENLHITRMRCTGEDNSPVVFKPTRLYMKNCLVSSNANPEDTGGISIWEGSMEIESSTFELNTGSSGGAILLDSFATLKATNVIFRNNKGVEGGAIKNVESDIQCHGCQFLNNQASDGGAVYLTDEDGTEATFKNTLFQGNQATKVGGQGGALFIEDANPIVKFCHTSFSGNLAVSDNPMGRQVPNNVYVGLHPHNFGYVKFCPVRPAAVIIRQGSESLVTVNCTVC